MKNMISISSGFQYSVNVKYDIDNINKISSYIPTEKSILILEGLFNSLNDNSNDRSHIVIGPYGTGKSHFVAFFGALLKAKLPKESFNPVLEKIELSNKKQLSYNLRKALQNNEKYLVVVINGNGQELEQVFISELNNALKQEGLNQLLPNTVYKEMKKRIEIWKQKYKNTYKTFIKLLQDQYSLSIVQFQQLLEKCDSKAYDIFSKLHPELTSGVDFDKLKTDDIAELYKETAVKVREKGYRGIYVIFDEFNKYLERALKTDENVDLKPLQDLAEMCNRSYENQVHLLLISHQHISQYASKLSRDLVNEWKKVEGRFKSYELTQKSSKTYNLISKVILKRDDKWKKYVNRFKKEFDKLKEKANVYGLFKDLTDTELENWVIKGCFPLHPVTTFSLPRICNKIAQNERTIFTFLATNDFYTLGNFIETKDFKDFSLLTIDVIYDYFKDIMKKQERESEIYKVWRDVDSIMKKYNNLDQLAIKVVKALGIIKCVGEEKSLPPTVEVLKYSLGLKKDEENKFNEIIRELIRKKVLYVRKSDGHIIFLINNSSDVNFDEEISKIRNNYRYKKFFKVDKILNEYFTPYPIIAHRYNDEYEMTRFFYPIFYTFEDFKKGINWDEELKAKGYADGILAFIITENHEEINSLKSLIKKFNHKQVVIAYTKKPLRIREILFNFQALKLLEKDKTFLEKDPFIKIELTAYLDDYTQQIENELSKLTDPRFGHVEYYNKFKSELVNKRINSSAKLSKLISGICKKVFDKTPKLNNELINKTNVSTNIVNARKKVIKGILEDKTQKNLGLKGYGPDVSIFRSLLRRTGIYNEKEVSLGPGHDKNLNLIIDKVEKWIKDKNYSSKNFNEIFVKLRKPPFGLRKGVLPIILALAIRKYKDVIVIKDKEHIERPLTAQLIEDISKRPSNFTLEVEDWDSYKENYLETLKQLFIDYVEKKWDTANRLYPVAMAMKSWFFSLPKFARETRMISIKTMSFRRTIKNPSLNSKELLFSRLPEYLIGDKQFEPNNYKKYLEHIRRSKIELEEFQDNVIKKIGEFITKEFSNIDGKNMCLSAVRDWYESLSTKTKNHLFEDEVSLFINTIKNFKGHNNSNFIYNLCRNISGLRMEDWSDQIYNNFISTIKRIKDKIEGYEKNVSKTDNLGTNEISIVISNSNGEKKERSFNLVKISQLGEVLLNAIESDIENYGDAISLNEKRKILLTVLEKLL